MIDGLTGPVIERVRSYNPNRENNMNEPKILSVQVPHDTYKEMCLHAGASMSSRSKVVRDALDMYLNVLLNRSGPGEVGRTPEEKAANRAIKLFCQPVGTVYPCTYEAAFGTAKGKGAQKELEKEWDEMEKKGLDIWGNPIGTKYPEEHPGHDD